MKLTELKKRVRKLERRLAVPSSPAELEKFSSSALLQALRLDAMRLKIEAEARGEIPSALACIRECVRIVELEAKLRGELEEHKETNILNVVLNKEIGTRIAQTYLLRQNGLESGK